MSQFQRVQLVLSHHKRGMMNGTTFPKKNESKTWLMKRTAESYHQLLRTASGHLASLPPV